MSAPHTNIEKQKRRHRGPLIGMAAVVAFVGAIFLYWLVYEARNAASPDTDPSLPTIGAPEEQGGANGQVSP